MKATVLLLAVACLPFLGGFAFAGGTMVWETSTMEDFNGGTLKGVVVYPPGGVRLGPTLSKIEVEEGSIWCLLDVQGRGLYFGTARGASVYRVLEGKAERVLELDDEVPPRKALPEEEGPVSRVPTS